MISRIDKNSIRQKRHQRTRRQIVGEMVAKRAIEKGVKQVVFDRGGYLYTGRVQKLADGARKAGLEF